MVTQVLPTLYPRLGGSRGVLRTLMTLAQVARGTAAVAVREDLPDGGGIPPRRGGI